MTKTRPEIQYPETGFYGDNILVKGRKESGERNSLQAKLPEGKKLKIVITGLSATYQIGFWYYLTGTSNNLAISIFDFSNYTQAFQSIDGGLLVHSACDLKKELFGLIIMRTMQSSPTYSKDIVVDY